MSTKVSLALLASLLVVAAPVAHGIYASPIQAGCYIAAPGDCRIRVDPFSVDITSGQKLVSVRIIAIRQSGGTQTTVYDWRPDQSNPAPASGTTYSPAIPSQDIAATCGQSYQISLQGQDTADPSAYNLGLTQTFACPNAVP